jgi:hypothetical protein
MPEAAACAAAASTYNADPEAVAKALGWDRALNVLTRGR